MDYVFVAQLENGKVICVSQLKKQGLKMSENLVLIASFDETLLGKTYNAETGAFEL
jgi:hypothetical protein